MTSGRRPAREWTLEDDRTLCDFYEKGWQVQKIAEVVDRSVGSCSDRIGKLCAKGEIVRRIMKQPTKLQVPEGPGIHAAPELVYLPSWSWACRLHWERIWGIDCAPGGRP